METVTVAHLRGQNTPTKMSKARSFNQLAAAGATPTTGYEPACKLRRTHSATDIKDSLYHLEHSHDYRSTEGDSSTMESNLQMTQDMECRMCTCRIDALHDYEGGSSKVSKMFEGRVCRNCRELAEYHPDFGSRESFLTIEDHESIGKQAEMQLRIDQLCRSLPEIWFERKKLVERDSTGEKPSSRNLSSKDEDEFDSDDSFEEIYHIPTVQGWFKLLTSKQQEKNGDEAILALVAQVKEREMSESSFNIYTKGFYRREDRSSRQGAVLRDFHNMPIAAWSSIDSDVESITPLHNELKGLSLGLKMAIQYQVTNFYIHCPSPMILYILGERICHCGEENFHTCRRCILPKVRGKEETFQLLLEIYPLIEQLNLSRHDLCYIDGEDNKAAHWMAELGEDRKMDLSEIKKHESLSKILYKDVFECFDDCSIKLCSYPELGA
ncbi:hypothetical protein M6B38_145200 [Iris pallida]|uniref:RNase H type-1 domain-containing protein n=1 Tax=Iris pallida TaxID=29817 RepID=A0AAX6F9J2_IRIPA|nr:hypothetical protein M6B38_145200 [Iris pallida]